MKTIKELITIKEYCKKHKITDAAVRKKISTNKLYSIIYEGITYVVIENNDKEKLKVSIKIKNSKIRELQKEKYFYDNQKETITKLENKIEKLEEKLEDQRDKKEELYEKVIGELTGQTKLLKMG